MQANDNNKLTGNGSFHEAPTIEGLTIARGRLDPSFINRCSAKCLVNVYVFGLLPISCGVTIFTISSSIHLKIEHNNQC